MNWIKQACRNIWWLLNIKPVEAPKEVDAGFYIDPKHYIDLTKDGRGCYKTVLWQNSWSSPLKND